MAAVMAIGCPLFNDRHRPEVLFPAGVVRQLGVAPGHLDTAVPQELLQTLQTHAGVQQLGGTGVPETMQTIALMRQACLVQILTKHHSGRSVAQALPSLAVKQTVLRRVSLCLLYTSDA